MKNHVHRRIILMMFLLGGLLGGCSQAVEETPPAVTDTITPVEQPVTPSPTIEEVEQPGLMVLLASAQADQSRVGDVSALVQQASSSHGLVFEQRENLSVESAPENLRVVVSIPPVEGLQALIDGLPQVQFVAVDAQDITIQANVSALPAGNSSLNAAFLSGYIAAVQSDEYRVGIISTTSPDGQDYRDAFLNGVLYFCGTCLPIYPPYEVYPTYAEVAPGATLEQIQAAAYTLQTLQVQIVHLDPQLESEPVLQMLAQSGFYIIGSSAPPSGLEGNWVGSILSETSMGLAEVVESALNGQAVGWLSAKLVLGYTGITEARINHFNEIIEMLESDEIDPLGLVN